MPSGGFEITIKAAGFMWQGSFHGYRNYVDMFCMVFVVIAPYWEERSFEDDDNTVYRGIT